MVYISLPFTNVIIAPPSHVLSLHLFPTPAPTVVTRVMGTQFAPAFLQLYREHRKKQAAEERLGIILETTGNYREMQYVNG